MLIFEFRMNGVWNGVQSQKQFTLHADAAKIVCDESCIPYISIENGRMFQILKDGPVPFVPREKCSAGIRFTVEEVLNDLTERLARNEKGILEPITTHEIVNVYAAAFKASIAAKEPRDIPYYIVYDGRMLHLKYATDKFLYYDDDLEMPVMFRTDDGNIVSNNEFAEIGFFESQQAVENGEERILDIKKYPGLSAKAFVTDKFSFVLEEWPRKFNMPHIESSPTSDASEELPF